MINDIWKYFLLVNGRTKETFLCVCSENKPYFFGEEIFFIANNKWVLGNYNELINKGFIDKLLSI